MTPRETPVEVPFASPPFPEMGVLNDDERAATVDKNEAYRVEPEVQPI